jgi:hypothetical protein
MPDLNSLLSKIQADHLNDTPAQIVSALNAKTIASKRPINTRDIKKYLILNSLWLAIKTSSNPVAVITIDALNLFDEFNVQESSVNSMLGQMMDGLIAANLTPSFNTTHKAEILSIGDVMASWADQNWMSDVQLWQVLEAMK